MNQPPTNAAGSIRPDGTRSIAVVDETGMLLRGDVGPEPQAAAGMMRPLSSEELSRIVAIAGRAPSLHNSQPWKFRAGTFSVDVLANWARQLHHADEGGRELLISCGAALFGLRLGMRTLGYLPAAELFPDPDRPEVLGRVRIAGQAPITRHESELLAAVHHRHTHRGPFTPGEVSPRLIAGMRMDAATEQAELIVLADPAQVEYLAGLVLIAAKEQDASALLAAETRGWARPAGTSARDGVPASALARQLSAADGGDAVPGRLPQRDFGIEGTADAGGAPPAVTAVLATAGDTAADWIQAGQALHRMLLRAATRWVFASLQSQPLESPARRAALRSRLGLTGAPQLVLQLGRANTATATARRLATETLTTDPRPR